MADLQNQRRKAHVKRIFNPNDSSVWIDVVRIDEFKVMTQPSGQGRVLVVKWDDAAGAGPTPTTDSANTKRKTSTLRVSDPSSAAFVDIDIIEEMTFVTQPGGQGETLVFKNTDVNENRQNDTMMVFHRDVSISMSDIVPFADYVDALGTKDTSQFIQAAVVKQFKVVTQPGGQGQKVILKNEDIEAILTPI